MGQFDSQESAFNFALDYLKSISNSLEMCKYFCSKNDYREWYKWLRIAFRESSVKIQDKDMNDYNDMFKDIVKLINANDTSKVGEILTKLDELEIKLRKEIQAKGMLLPSKSDPRYAGLER